MKEARPMKSPLIPSRVAPIRISPNGRYFVDRSGSPWFWLGDTQWHLFRSFKLEDVQAIIQNRKAKGFGALLIMLMGYEGDPVANVHGDLPWIDNDPSRPNERYFEHVDAAMRIACELDMIQVLGVYHKSQARYHTPGKAEALATWIARRYRDVPQIIWSMYPEARNQYAPVVQAIARGLQHGDGGAHMISVHPDPSPQSSSFLHDQPWLAFNMLQTCIDIELIQPMVAADYGMTPIKPVVMAEGGYEGVEFNRPFTPLDIRRQAWWTHLAGGHHVYGHNDHYRLLHQWREWIDAPGSLHLRTFRDIATSLKAWWNLIPDQSIIASSADVGADLTVAARSQASDWALVYFASPGSRTIRMDRIRSADTIVTSWIHPITGDRSMAGEFPYTKPVEFTPPQSWEDALLLMEGKT